MTGPGLEIERALSESQRRKLLDAADHLPIISGRSKDRRRPKHLEFPDERPRRKGARPWRNRAIVYCLIETGMPRAAACNLDLSEIDFEKTSVSVREKGGQTHRYKISKEGAKAILDYLRDERDTLRRLRCQSIPTANLRGASQMHSNCWASHMTNLIKRTVPAIICSAPFKNADFFNVPSYLSLPRRLVWSSLEMEGEAFM